MKQIAKKNYPLASREFDKRYFKVMTQIIASRRKKCPVYPEKEEMYKALALVPVQDVKVVIIGQDPYPAEYADGLAFSSKTDVCPSSLKEIFNSIKKQIPEATHTTNSLEGWAKQGVLLLNTILTTEPVPLAHAYLGWQYYTSSVCAEINMQNREIYWLLWGKYAYKYRHYITNHLHKILICSHPSPLGSHAKMANYPAFKDNDHFIQTKHINWST